MQNALFSIVITIFLLCPTSPVDAAIYKCDNNGVITIQDKPCKEGRQENTDKLSSALTKDIHPSWFDRPVYLAGQAKCIDGLCKCEGYARRYSDDEKGLRQVLTSFKGSWVRFERQYRKHNKHGQSSAGRLKLEKQACEIAVKQAWVKKLYRKNIAKLRDTLNAGTQNDQETNNCTALKNKRSAWVECESRARLQNHENMKETKKLEKYRTDFNKSMKILATPRKEYLASARI